MTSSSTSTPCDTVGINVIGHVGANLGVGVATRQLIDLLAHRGHPIAAFDVDSGTRRERPERRFDALLCHDAASLPHRISIFVLGLGAVDWVLGRCPDRLFDDDHLSVLVCFWELPVVPAARLAQIDGFDVVVAPSDFLRHVFDDCLRRAIVVPGALPVVLPAGEPFARESLGIPADAIVLCFSFDPASDPERKNPAGVITAFRRAAEAARGDAWLVMRINNAGAPGSARHPVVDALHAAADDHPKIRFVTGSMSYPEVLGLYRASDVFVSLHRAEGLGLAMAEAMTMGMPVIATGWSGNTTFMRHGNGCLVGYELVRVKPSLPAYAEENLVGDARWAEPRLDEAAALMAWLIDDAGMRCALGRAAALSMKHYNDEANRGAFVDDILAIDKARRALHSHGYRPVGAVRGRPSFTPPAKPLMRRANEGARHLFVRARRRLSRLATGSGR